VHHDRGSNKGPGPRTFQVYSRRGKMNLSREEEGTSNLLLEEDCSRKLLEEEAGTVTCGREIVEGLNYK